MIRETSKKAFAESLGRHGTWRRKIYDAISESGKRGMTSDELLIMFKSTRRDGLTGSAVQPRITELHQLGYIYRTTRSRLSRAGHACTVYRVRRKIRPMRQHVCPLCDSKITTRQARKVRDRIDSD